MKEHVQINLFLADSLNDVERSAFQNLLMQSKYVRDVHYISKEEALDSLKKYLGESAVSMLEDNPLPSSFEVKLKAAYTHPDSIKNIATQLEQNKLVREVNYQQTEVSKMTANFRTIGIIILVFCSLLLVIAVALINSTIRLAMYSRRFLIKSMQLVGATKRFIRRPFIRRSIFHGFYAGIIATILLGTMMYLVRMRLPGMVQIQDIQSIGILMGGLLIFGILLSTFSTFLSVNRFLRLRIENLYGQ